MPYLRDENLARPWAIPGTPGLQHRIGGLEKEDGTGNISYEPENHALMTRLRAERIANIADDIPELEVDARRGTPSCWCWAGGRATAPIHGAARRVRREQGAASPSPHLHHLNPLPRNIGEVVRAYPKVLVPGDEHGPARQDPPLRVPRRRRERSRRWTAFRSSPRPRAGSAGEALMAHDGAPNGPAATAATAAHADEEGLRLRPGDALVPGLRRLRDPRDGAGRSCPSSACRRSGPCSSRASAAPAASSTTWTPTGCTASTAARRRSRPASPPRGRTSRSGS